MGTIEDRVRDSLKQGSEPSSLKKSRDSAPADPHRLMTQQHASAHASCKSALVGLVWSWAVELAPRGMMTA